MSNAPAARRFFSGTTLERAVLEAAGHYDVDPKDLAYTRQGGGVASRGKVVIKVDPASPTHSADAVADSAESRSASPTLQVEEPREEAPAAADDQERGDEHEIQGDDPQDEEAQEDSAPEQSDENVDAEDAEDDSDEDLQADEDEPEPGESDDDREDEDEELSASAASSELQDLPRSVAEARRSWSAPDEDTAASARKWAESLLRLASLDLEVEVHERDGEIAVHLAGADAEVAVDDGGEVLRAIQHLLPRLMLSDLGHTVRCRVDCNDFREIHEEELRNKALQAAQEVLSGAREVTLEPMHPADRRVVHLALAESELVRTESLGRGFFKRVSIRSN